MPERWRSRAGKNIPGQVGEHVCSGPGRGLGAEPEREEGSDHLGPHGAGKTPDLTSGARGGCGGVAVI